MMKKRHRWLTLSFGLLLFITVAGVGITVVQKTNQRLPFAPFQEQAPNLVLQADVTQDNGTKTLQFFVEQTVDHQRPFYEYKMTSSQGELVQYQAILGQQFIFGIGEFQQKQKATPEQVANAMLNADAQIINDYFFNDDATQAKEQVYDTLEYVGKELILGRVTYRFRCGYEKSQEISQTTFTKEMWLDEKTGVTLKAIETTEFELQDATQPLETTFQKTFEVRQLTLNEVAS
ncbi:MAG: hypothetical protein ACRDCZ_04335 [Culicoidibacterales bacterium]